MKTEAAAAETRDLDPVEFAARARFPLPSTLIEAMMANESEASAHASSVWTNDPLFQPKGWQPPVAFSAESLLFSQALHTSGLLDSRAYLGVNILSPIVCLSPFFPSSTHSQPSPPPPPLLPAPSAHQPKRKPDYPMNASCIINELCCVLILHCVHILLLMLPRLPLTRSRPKKHNSFCFCSLFFKESLRFIIFLCGKDQRVAAALLLCCCRHAGVKGDRQCNMCSANIWLIRTLCKQFTHRFYVCSHAGVKEVRVP